MGTVTQVLDSFEFLTVYVVQRPYKHRLAHSLMKFHMQARHAESSDAVE